MSPELAQAVAVLERGGVVAAATETLMGLLADATRSDAIDRLLALKPRGAEQGIPLILPDRESWPALVSELPELAVRLADRFWPGPLTIAVAARSDLDPRLVLDGTVAVRVPRASPAAELARAFGRPLTATSANAPGEPAADRAEQVRAAFAAAVAEKKLFVLPGAAPGGSASSVVVVRGAALRIVRAGAISAHDIESVRD